MKILVLNVGTDTMKSPRPSLGSVSSEGGRGGGGGGGAGRLLYGPCGLCSGG